ncbi:MAG: hypothetical protein V8T45_10780, partial [Oscillospiraceae bacterium]
IPLLLAVFLLSGCGDTGPWRCPRWTRPPRRSPPPPRCSAAPHRESIHRNEILSFNMSDPGVSGSVLNRN